MPTAVLDHLVLAALTLVHPDPERAQAVLQALGVDRPVAPGEEPRIRATRATAQGEVVLG